MRENKNRAGAITAEEVEAKLPLRYFVMRGHVRDALGLSEEEMTVMVENKIFRAEYPVKGGRARFVRSKIVAYARKLEN